MATVQVKDLTTKSLDSTLCLLVQELAGGAGSCGKVSAGKVLGAGFYEITTADDVVLTNSCPSNIKINITVSGKSVSLPVMNSSSSMSSNGIGRIYLYNKGAESFELLDNGGNVLEAVVLPGDFLMVLIDDSATANGTFTIHKFSEGFTLGSGYIELNNVGTYNATNPMKTVMNVTDAGAGTNIILADMTDSNALKANKCPNFIVYNNHPGSSAVNVKDHDLTTLVTIEPGEGYLFTVTSNAAAAGTFIFERIVFPAASATLSGYVTTGAQTFAGDKTFAGSVTAPTFSGINQNTLTISQGTDYQMTNPAPERVNATFTVPGCSLITPDYNPSLTNLTRTSICIFNAGSETFILEKFGPVILYSMVLPGQTIVLYPTGGGADYSISNEHIAPTDFGVIPFSKSGGSYTYTSDSSLKYDLAGETLYATQFAGVNKDILNISQAGSYTLTNPCPNLIRADFSADFQSIIFPDMTEVNAPKTPIRIVNISSTNTVILRSNPGFSFYTQLLPGQIVDVYPIDWSSAAGSFQVFNLNIPPSDFGGMPYAVSGGSYTYKTSPNMTFDGNILYLGSLTGGLRLPFGGTTLDRYEESGTIFLSATGALSTTFIILIKRVGRMAILNIAGFTASVTSSGNKIVSSTGVASQFRPASTITWTIPIIDGASSSTRATGELSLSSSGIVTLASTNGANFTGANAGIIEACVPYFPSL